MMIPHRSRGVSRAADAPPPLIFSKKIQPPPPMTGKCRRFSSRRRWDPNPLQPPPSITEVVNKNFSRRSYCRNINTQIFYILNSLGQFPEFSQLVSYELILNSHYPLFFMQKSFQKQGVSFKKSGKIPAVSAENEIFLAAAADREKKIETF